MLLNKLYRNGLLHVQRVWPLVSQLPQGSLQVLWNDWSLDYRMHRHALCQEHGSHNPGGDDDSLSPAQGHRQDL